MSDAAQPAVSSLVSHLRLSGVISLVAGAACLFMPLLAGASAFILLGIAILAAGVASFDAARRVPKGTKGRGRYVAEALAVLAVGVLIVLAPMIGSAILTWAIAIPALVVGMSRIAAALELRPRPEWTRVLGVGVILTIIGVMVLADWPFAGARVVGIAIGFGFILDGIVRMKTAHALSARS